MRTATKFAFRFFLFALMTTQLWAQGVATADLSGTVTEPNGAVVAGAQVALRDEARAFERMTISDDEGVYQFLLVPPGRYSLTVEAKRPIAIICVNNGNRSATGGDGTEP